MLQWTFVCVSFWILVFSGYMHRNGTAGSYGNSIFSFLRNHHIVFHSDCTSLHSHQHCKRVPFFPHPLQNFICRLFDDGHSDRCEVIPQGSFDLRFLITSDVEHLFMCLLEKCHLWKNVSLGLLPIFGLNFVVVFIELYELFVYFEN